MNLLYEKMRLLGLMFRGDGGDGGGGGDGDGDGSDGGASDGDASDGDDGSAAAIGAGVSGPSAGPGAGPGGPGTGPASNSDVGSIGDAVGMGQISGIPASIASMAINGITGITGLGQAAIGTVNGNPGQAASGVGAIAGMGIGGPVGAAIGAAIGSAIGNAPGVPSASVPGDPSGGGSGNPNAAGIQAISGGLGMRPNTQRPLPGVGTLGGTPNFGAVPVRVGQGPYNPNATLQYLRKSGALDKGSDASGLRDGTNSLVQALRQPSSGFTAL